MSDPVAAADRSTVDLPSLFQTHYLDLVRLAVQLVDDLPIAEDVVQDVFARMHSGSVLPQAPLGYLRAAVLNGCRSTLRHRRTVRGSAPGTPMEPASGADGPSLAAADQIRLLGAIDALPRRQREVIVLRYYEDLSVAEVAELLGITRAAVSASASVAMVALRRALGDEHDRNA